MFTKSFASLVCHVVGLFPSDKNDFLNLKSHDREKPLLPGYKSLVMSQVNIIKDNK